jgi:phospholipid transport system substrate-binding protein
MLSETSRKTTKKKTNNFFRRKQMKKNIIIAVFGLLLFLPASVLAGAPLDTVKDHADKVLEVLRDPALKAESAKKAKKEKIRAIAENMFDFSELSRRTLGQNWNKLNSEQQKEFITLYESVLEDAYSNKIMAYTDEKIVFSKEIKLTEKTTEVQSTVLKRNGEIPIFYRVILKDGVWRVYDVVIEGVSLINNYRTQYREILVNKTPEALLETMRKKAGKV